MKSKTLKALKIDIDTKIDKFIGDEIINVDVEINCEDKECLLNGIFEKMNLIVGGNKTFDKELISKLNNI